MKGSGLSSTFPQTQARPKQPRTKAAYIPRTRSNTLQKEQMSRKGPLVKAALDRLPRHQDFLKFPSVQLGLRTAAEKWRFLNPAQQLSQHLR